MKSKVKNINSFTREISISVQWKELSKDYELEFNKAKKNFNMPGFRKGKAPNSIVEKQIGPTVDARFAEHSINIFYKKALEENKLIPVNQANINHVEFQKGFDLKFIAQFEILPQFDLPNYQKKIKVNVIKYIASDNDINHSLNNLRERYATIEDVQSGAVKGNFIKCDISTLDHDQNIKKDQQVLRDQYIKIGSGLFKGKLEKKFIGCKVGNQINAMLTLKDNKETYYRFDIKKVEKHILPELTDEFIKNLNNDIKSLKDLKNQLREQIQGSYNQEYDKDINNQIVEYFIQKTKLDVPTSMIENYLDNLMNDYKSKGQTIDEVKFKQDYKTISENTVKWFLIKPEIIKDIKITVQDDEISKYVSQLIKDNPNQKNELEKYYEDSANQPSIREELVNKKLFDALRNYFIIKTEEKERPQS